MDLAPTLTSDSSAAGQGGILQGVEARLPRKDVIRVMNGIRWLAWLPLALAASIAAGAAGTWYSEFHEGSPWYVWTVSGAASGWAFLYVALRVAPNPSAAVKWIAVVVLGSIGIVSALGSLLGTEPVRALTGAVMAVFAIYYARLPIAAIRAEVDAMSGE